MPDVTLDLHDRPEHEDGPFIAGISDYCNRWCERCPYTDRCRLFYDTRWEATQQNRDCVAHLTVDLAAAMKLLNAWCEQHVHTGQLHDAQAGSRSADTRSDPLLKAAETYTKAAHHLLKALGRATNGDLLPEAARDAIETIHSYLLPISSKTHRALSGYADQEDIADRDAVQNDWNGSAKVARLLVMESKTAWERLIEAGDASPGSAIRSMPQLLASIDRQLAARFPRAMDFIRPAFDARSGRTG